MLGFFLLHRSWRWMTVYIAPITHMVGGGKHKAGDNALDFLNKATVSE
jgi:hypothetical protein